MPPKQDTNDELAVAKKARTGAQGWLTRAAKACEDLSHGELGESDSVDYESTLANFTRRLAIWDQAEEKFEMLVEEDELDGEIQKAADYREKTEKSLTILISAWSRAHPLPLAVGGNQAGSGGTGGRQQNIKLPKLDLPKFSGDVMKFMTFWQQFTACVDEQEDIPTVTKFNYLVGLLKGDAKAVLEGLPITAENYEQAKNIVNKRFGRKELVIFAHIQTLLSLPVAAKDTELTQFYDKLVANVRSLNSMAIHSDNFGVILTPIVVSRLAPEIRAEWSRDSEGHEADLDHLMEFLEKELRRRERCKTLIGLEEQPREQQPVNDRTRVRWQGRSPGSATALHNSSGERKCDFCDKKNHWSSSCYAYLKLDVNCRQEMVGKSRLCFKCLSKKHIAKNCNSVCENCQGHHHLTLCYKSKDVNTKISKGSSSALQTCSSDGSSSVGQNDCDINQSDSSIHTPALTVSNKVYANVSLLPVAKVRVQGVDGWHSATLLFDSGSDRSYVSQSMVRKVKPKWVRNAEVSFSTFGGRSHGSRSKVYGMTLKGDKSECKKGVELTEVPVICLPLSKPVIDSKLLEEFDHLALAFDFADKGSLDIDILIGQDLFWSLMRGKVCREEKSGIVAQESIFGWVLSGASGRQAHSGVSLLNLCSIPDNVVKSFWDLESIGVKDDDCSVDLVLKEFEEGIKYKQESGRYQVGLTWKKQHPPLLDNKKTALSSLFRLEKRLEKNRELQEEYKKALNEMEEDGFIEEVGDERSPDLLGSVFYLPHFPRVRESSISTRVRPVFDASCKGPNGVSLNDCLEAGPNLNPGVVDIVLRFRRWRYAVSADVKKAFLQIELKEEDQDVHRFFWRKNCKIKIMRFLRVAFGIKCSPFLLSGTIQYHLSQCPPSFVIKELSENLYVDDFLSGADSQSEVHDLFKEANKVMEKAGMKLAKWTSNESSLLGEGFDSSGLNSQNVKVLGVSWDPDKDEFTIKAANLPGHIRCTKRVVLSLIARVFDPLGFVLPFTVSARFLFQDVWRLGIDWDEELPDCLQDAFRRWLTGLGGLEEIAIPRQYFEAPWAECLRSIELHAFGDASLKGYGACVYLRYQSASGDKRCTLVRACARVAPLERKTLPRLELLGSLVTAELLQSVIKGLQLPVDVKYTCWSDSMVALGWIQGLPSKWKPWVANRVSSIQSLTNSGRWKHIAGLENPADLVSRGVSAEKLVSSHLWWHGPSFLSEAEQKIPQVIVLPKDDADVEAERRVVVNEAMLTCSDVPCMFQMERWSTLNKALRVIGWILRFIHRVRKVKLTSGMELCTVDYALAKEAFVKILQYQHFATEIAILKCEKAIPKNSRLIRFAPFLDDNGVMRVGGRIQLSELAYESKHPVILPKCHGSKLIIRYAHILQNHAGVGAMIAYVRRDYEIFGLRQLAKSVKKSCVFCQRYDVRACNEPPAPLPRLRVTMAPVFSVTGIDFAGPVYCSDFPEKKFYICLFVCGVVRAIHLELVESLTGDDFILAFRRFSALKRMPTVVYSDNGKNFVGGQRTLSSYLGHAMPQWRFICPRSPWWGGWWERLVRSVKNGVRKTIGKNCLTRVEFETCLCEVAASINSRPLTFVGTDVENKVPLTPNHFLAGQGNQSLDSKVVEDPENVSVEKLSLRHQEMMERQDDFWRVWSSEYIRNLPAAFQKFRKEGNLQVGSVVLIREDGLPRMKWCVGVVEKLHEGKDGIPRAADIRTSKGHRTRAVQRLYNLEISDKSDDGKMDDSSAVDAGVDQVAVGGQEPIEDDIANVNRGSSVDRPVRRKRLPARFDDYDM